MLPPTKHLKVFQAICREGSMKRAGDLLHRSRSAVSHALDELEAALGVNLFERKPHGMLLTDFGQILARRVDYALDEMSTARSVLWASRSAAGAQYANAPIYTLSVSEQRLQMFLDFAQQRHMSVVARRIGVSQPAVSMALRDLEQSVGQRLFEAVSGSFRLTPAGQTLINHLKRALAQLRLADAEIAAIEIGVRGSVAAGVLPFGGGSVLVPAIARLLALHPQVRVSTHEARFDRLMSQLWCGDIDLVVGALQSVESYGGLVTETLYEEPIVVVTRAGHPLTRLPSPSLNDLIAAQWVLPAEGTPTRTAVWDALDQAGLAHPEVAVEASNVSIVRGLLLDTDLISAGAKRLFRHDLQSGALVTLGHDPVIAYRTIGLFMRTPDHSSPVAQLLVEQLRQLARNYQGV